ncbi:MAG: SDR family oxidoreductase [Planctomycetes bacterium]|nr:SDR family oxidoreductase [Planctomycetota bacterium]
MPSQSFADLTGRRAVVTGASSGIGRAIALELARGGADVLIHCRSSITLAEQVCDECRAAGRQADVMACDFAESSQLSTFVEHVWSHWGEPDIWINNAGVALLTGPAAQLDFASKLQRLFDVDVRSTLILGREAGQRMHQARGGVMLNVGWDQADRGMEGASGELFAASKNAIMGFTRSLSVSLAPAVRVNCIAPGWIRTAWGEGASAVWQERVLRETPLQRWGTPEDIAWLARFLGSDQAAYITGQVINANGGAVR